MPHTLDAVVFDPLTDKILMVVSPDDDRQLDDPAFYPPGAVHIHVPHGLVSDKQLGALELSRLPLDFLKRVAVA